MCSPCNHQCQQGRECPARLQEPDEPPISCEAAQRLPFYVVAAVVLAAIGAALSFLF